MSWDRFHYICRRVAKARQPEETVESTIVRIENDPGIKLYGDLGEPGSLPDRLLAEIKGITDNDAAFRVLDLYRGLDVVVQT